MKTKLAFLRYVSGGRAALPCRRSSGVVLFAFCSMCVFSFSSVMAADEAVLAPPPVRFVENFTNASTPKIEAAKTWTVYPAAEIYVAPGAANATVVTNGPAAQTQSTTAPGQPVTAPPNPAAQTQNVPTDTATPPAPNPDNVPNNFEAAPSLQGAR